MFEKLIRVCTLGFFLFVCHNQEIVASDNCRNEVITIHRDTNFLQKNVDDEQRLRVTAGAIDSYVKTDSQGNYVLETKWSVIGEPNCFVTSMEVFSEWQRYPNNTQKIVVKGDTIIAHADSLSRSFSCIETSSGGRHSDYGRTLELQARHNALGACKSHGFVSCEELSSACVRVQNNGSHGSTWSVVMKGSK